jgi:hypothetical protein
MRETSFFHDVRSILSLDNRQGYITNILLSTHSIGKASDSKVIKYDVSGKQNVSLPERKGPFSFLKRTILGQLLEWERLKKLKEYKEGKSSRMSWISDVGVYAARANFHISSAVSGFDGSSPGDGLKKIQKISRWRMPIKAIVSSPSIVLYGCCHGLKQMDKFAAEKIKNPTIKNITQGIVNAVALPFSVAAVTYTCLTIGLVMSVESTIKYVAAQKSKIKAALVKDTILQEEQKSVPSPSIPKVISPKIQKRASNLMAGLQSQKSHVCPTITHTTSREKGGGGRLL